jgi:hypothetical protein
LQNASFVNDSAVGGAASGSGQNGQGTKAAHYSSTLVRPRPTRVRLRVSRATRPVM